MVDRSLTEDSAAGRLLGRLGIGLLGAYLLLLPVVLLWLLVAIFPPATATTAQTTSAPAGQSPATTADQKTGATTVTQTATIPAPKFGRITVLAFPWKVTIGPLSDDQGLILLAILAGGLGSYLHVAQSFSAYVGNRQAMRSWVWWYLLRAPIGASLGVLVYFVVRAGLMSGVTDAVSPYGVVAFGALAGMFSKQATDKLAEIFDTLFRSQKESEYKDKLASTLTVTSVSPSPVPAGAGPVDLTVTGTSFLKGAVVRMNDATLPTDFKSSTQLTATIPAASRPASGTDVTITVVNPDSASTPSAPVSLHFA